jgi:hypothetical protein
MLDSVIPDWLEPPPLPPSLPPLRTMSESMWAHQNGSKHNILTLIGIKARPTTKDTTHTLALIYFLIELHLKP